MQSANFAKELPGYTQTARDRIVDLICSLRRAFGMPGSARGKSEVPHYQYRKLVARLRLLRALGQLRPLRQQQLQRRERPRPQPKSIAPTPPSKLTTAERQRIQADGGKD